MRVVIAMMKHETNTFSPVPTPLERFARGQALPFYGPEAYEAYKGTGSAMGAFIDLAEAVGAEIETPIAANAWPSGPVEDEAYVQMSDAISEAVAKGPDAVLLDLHGAMVTESREDGEGELLARLRGIAPDVPIAVALDMHTNMCDAIVANATSVAGYQTYPHIDNYETGIRAGRPVFGLLEGEARPTMAWGNRPMLPHVMRQGTDDSPNRELQARTKAMEAEGGLAVSLFTGFPHADIANAGLSVVVVTDDDLGLAERWRDELLDWAWAERQAFVYQIEPLERSLARAREVGEGPVVLLDHYDNAASGGTMDTMAVLGGILDAGLEDVAAFAIHDPEAVQQMIDAGVGAEVTIRLGGNLDMPSVGRKGEPRQVSGRVKHISDGRYRNLGPGLQGHPHGHGADGRAGHRPGRDRGDLPPSGAERPRLLEEPRHRARGQALPHAEEPDPLPRRLQADCQGGHRMRRHRRLYLRLWPARLPQGAPADLPARPDGRGVSGDAG